MGRDANRDVGNRKKRGSQRLGRNGAADAGASPFRPAARLRACASRSSNRHIAAWTVLSPRPTASANVFVGRPKLHRARPLSSIADPFPPFSGEQQIISGRLWHDRAAMTYGREAMTYGNVRRVFGGAVGAVLAFVACPAGMAQEAAGQAPAAKAPAAKAARVDWETCVAAPTRVCVLEEALIAALSAGPSQGGALQLGKIVEAQAASGNLQVALEIAQSIPSGEQPRITALAAIAGAQSRHGLASDAGETLTQARRLAYALKNQLERAEALQSIGESESEAGMVTEAEATFRETLRQVESLDIPPSLSRCTFPTPEERVEAVLKRLALRQDKAGNIADSLRTALTIRYDFAGRVEALRAVADMQAQAGRADEAGVILKEAQETVRASGTPPENWRSCPLVRRGSIPGQAYVAMMSDVARAQATAGLTDDAAASIKEALDAIPDIGDGPLPADAAKVVALSAVARAQHDAGFTTVSAATFERAMQAAALDDALHSSLRFTALGHDRYQAGRIAEATRAFDAALAAARSLDSGTARTRELRPDALLHVLIARLQAGLAADADAVLTEIRDAMLRIVEGSPRVSWLQGIAWAQERMGRREEALATYRQALQAADVESNKVVRANQLMDLIWPGGLLEPRWIAESAPQVARMAHAIEDPSRRASALLALAQALPD
jgi:tetratricopeptide (TPR) repeat protein